MTTIVRNFTYTGTTQTFLVPRGVNEIFIQLWGAAGGSQGGRGGAGGYSQGTLQVSKGETLSIIVGQGGINNSTSQTACLQPTFGGGGGGGACTEIYKGSSGGGRTAILDNNSIEVITAGGGGGSSSSYSEGGGIAAGSGGGTVGYNAIANLVCYDSMMGKGGNQSNAGTGGVGWTTFNNGTDGAQFSGGTGGGGSNGGSSAGSAGGGGGGYYGGGGGAGEYQAGTGCPPSAGSQDCSGGGGSGYIGGVLGGLTLATTITRASFPAVINPPNNTNSNYITGVGVAQNGIGGNGLAVFTYTVVNLIKYVDKQIATIGDVVNYTLVFTNTLTGTADNVIIVDTIPNGTTFVNNSLAIDGSIVAGSIVPPGINIGSIVDKSTITFSVRVTTIPNPNPMINIGTVGADGLTPYNSNSVSTMVNYSILSSSKIVNKNYGNIGDILTYTIPIINTGNVTATNIIFQDTIPPDVTFVTGSLKQDGTQIVGTSNPPGITLPNNLGANKTTTITFQVKITTIPNPNPVTNSATVVGDYVVDSTTVPNVVGTSSSNTNQVITMINNASLANIQKSVNKIYATCNDVLTYTITVPNSGNITAIGVIVSDTIPNGATFIPGTLTINGVITNENPNSIYVGTIPGGSQAVITFNAKIVC